MAGKKCVLTVLVAVVLIQICNGTSVKDVPEEDVMRRLLVLENNQRESQAEIQALREIVADQKDTIDKQSVKLRTLEQDITTLKASQHRQVKRFQRAEKFLKVLLQNNRRKTEAQDSDTKDESVPSNVEENVTNGRGGIQPGKDGHVNVNVSKRQVPEVVAFTAYLDHDENLGIHQVIKYNKVITNEGGGYNNNTGVFTCVTEGLYLIYFAIGERDAHQQTASLRVNSQNVVDATVEGAHVHQDLQGGNMAVVRLHQGDSVWIESMGDNHHVEGGPAIRLTTFTGVLLY